MGEMMCCPLSGNDGFSGEMYGASVVKAAKDHKCEECQAPIAVGTKHERAKGMWDGKWAVFRTCLSCVEIRDRFACGNGWLFGYLWEDLENNFFPGMRAGGPGLDGLSPEAKSRMFEMRFAWVLKQGEWDTPSPVRGQG